ncbi:MAG: hypothetical protein ACE5KE_01565 [Methanosarcinales archaeon]
MGKWKYKSLEWIHKIREENYEKTKDKSLSEIIRNSVMESKKRSMEYGC